MPKLISMLCAMICIFCQHAFASSIDKSVREKLQFSFAGGGSWLQTSKNNQLVISDYETDSLHNLHVARSSLWKGGVGYPILMERLQNRQLLNQLLLEVNVYYTSTTIYGDVWQYKLPQFNNYSFNAPFTSTRVMLEAKPNLFTYQYISPYAIFGVGMAWNDLTYRERVTGAGIDPLSYLPLQEKQNHKIAYDLGFGMQVKISNRLSVMLEYLYTYLGSVSASYARANDVALQTPPVFTFHSQNIMAGIRWCF
ncbi:outer membrane protein [Legionella oakridgensis]|uniref:Outer membrane protein beta-barrel domain-containing protein n=2 Tax=Legionella oakridgensis TaxID=29423 RepID=W0BEM9_9GAMM|nr:outer membrane beta-barrel protein [Legionella oakridgensis]AHE66864.1 hypothetical protein Loa_01311 [Legionella oakridgensis ATCC 33761 = DSM 21215]ETO93437.1 opacity protein [Legionella oakridgensis RV-2-2007]KTD39755.1 hypothetical protein Loak_0862 [Legionella oakridgensis]STY19975.1 Opacity protein and related surface antigens [Legionella longbeachae]